MSITLSAARIKAKLQFILCLTALLTLPGCAGGKNASPSSSALTRPVAALVSTNDSELADKVDSITDFRTGLEPQLWDGMSLRPEIRIQAEKLGDMVAGQLDVRGVSVRDIVVLGSIASYEYDEHADFDLQVYVDTTQYAGDIDLLKKYLTHFTSTMRAKYKGITFHGYPVELSVFAADPLSEANIGVAIYSVKSGDWLKHPTQHSNRFDKDRIFLDAKQYIERYNLAAETFNRQPVGFDCSIFSSLLADMRSYRVQGIRQDGIRSTPNLTFRLLRRLNINLPSDLREINRQCVNLNASLPQ